MEIQAEAEREAKLKASPFGSAKPREQTLASRMGAWSVKTCPSITHVQPCAHISCRENGGGGFARSDQAREAAVEAESAADRREGSTRGEQAAPISQDTGL
eukprot:scaffold5246_cov21-Tisochrysis_lutea.AAC.2